MRRSGADTSPRYRAARALRAPVFVDDTGRRLTRTRIAAWAGGGPLAGFLATALLAVGFGPLGGPAEWARLSEALTAPPASRVTPPTATPQADATPTPAQPAIGIATPLPMALSDAGARATSTRPPTSPGPSTTPAGTPTPSPTTSPQRAPGVVRKPPAPPGKTDEPRKPTAPPGRASDPGKPTQPPGQSSDLAAQSTTTGLS